MSDTPRTDALVDADGLRQLIVARELERELNAAKAELAQRTADRDEAVNALRRIANYDYPGKQSGQS